MSILVGVKLFYPSAKEWMWSYCVYLGPFTDSKGSNYDLGIYMGDYDAFGYASAAIVYGNEEGNYLSGTLRSDSEIEHYQETYRRAKEIGLIK
jgi:hypothetical protein